MIAFNKYLPKWRNGRRTGLKIPRGQLHEGSTPSFGTNEKTALRAQFCQQVSKRFALTLVFSFHDQAKIALRWRFCRDYFVRKLFEGGRDFKSRLKACRPDRDEVSPGLSLTSLLAKNKPLACFFTRRPRKGNFMRVRPQCYVVVQCK